MTILDKIIERKKFEVEQLNINGYKRYYESMKYVSDILPTSDSMHIIAEIKRSSPSKGAINCAIDPVTQAKNYEKFGASVISVLTDKTFFNGSMEDLRTVREAVNLPILCKDFMIDKIQIDQAKNAGANMILLIVAALTRHKLLELYNYAKQQDLEVLCEVHNEKEMKTAINLEASIIGINNRNLKTFDVDLNVTDRLAPMIDNSATTLISESGIKTRSDVRQVAKAGTKGILVGETLMRSQELEATFRELKVPLPVKGVNVDAR